MAVFEALAIVLVTLIAPFVTRALWNYLNSPLKSFPGYTSTLFSNAWRFLDVWSRGAQVTHLDLYKKHGDAVRMGPNTVMISDPDLIPAIFTTRNAWLKSAMTYPNDVMVNGVRISNMFSTRDEMWHSKVMKPLGTHYTMTRVLDIEVHVDNMLNEMMRIIKERFAETKQTMDIAEWSKFFAWDSMRNLTFGKPYGLMEAGIDKGSVIATSTRGLEYYAPVSQIPQLDMLLDKNPVHRVGPPPLLWATIESYGAVAERKVEPTETAFSRQSDFLDKFIEMSKQYPETVDDNTIVAYVLNNVLAGSDTTAIHMCAALYYILKNPDVHARLQAELDAANVSVPVSYRAASSLPYFDAVMKEAARIHPGVGIMVERIVPAGGLKLSDGRFVPEGAVVGVNPWVINQVERVYGPNPEKFIPERWLPQPEESEEEYQKRMQRMKNGDFTFGYGARQCIGKNLAIMQTYKMVATLLKSFDMRLVSQEREWTIRNCWFTYVYDVPIKILPRKG